MKLTKKFLYKCTNVSAGKSLRHSTMCCELEGQPVIVATALARRSAKPGGKTAHEQNGLPLCKTAL